VSAGAVVDIDGVLTGWLRRTGAAALALRPDGFVYAAAGPDDALAPPPPGLRVTADATEAHLTKGSR